LPLPSGHFFFEVRDPEFPQFDPIQAIASVDGSSVDFEIVGDSSRFPKHSHFTGTLAWNATRKQWLFVTKPEDAQAKDSGPCGGDTNVVDLENFLLWVC
jgi:hypothetical protein